MRWIIYELGLSNKTDCIVWVNGIQTCLYKHVTSRNTNIGIEYIDTVIWSYLQRQEKVMKKRRKKGKKEEKKQKINNKGKKKVMRHPRHGRKEWGVFRFMQKQEHPGI